VKSILTIFTIFFFFSGHAKAEAAYYQIGSDFERSFHKNLDNIPQDLHKAALSVAQFGNSTAFYVGEHEGKDIMVTTAHSALSNVTNFSRSIKYYEQNTQVLCRIFVDSENSPKREFQFNLLGEYFLCKNLIAIFPKLDLAFFELEPKNKVDLSSYGIDFKAPKEFKKGDSFSYFSYSGFKNTGHIYFDLGFTNGHLCTPLINSDEVDYLESFDDLTRETIEVPTIPIGCDASPGDSGAPLLNDEGSLVGVLWAVSGSSNESVSNQDYLEALIDKQTPYLETERDFVWKNFNYASSLEKSIEEIRSHTESCESVACEVLKSLINAN